MRADPDYYFPLPEEIISDMKTFASQLQGQSNLIKIIVEKFPELSQELQGNINK